ncbi:MAG: M23 family metallopeptidase, partial [Dehalococcoidia bacterium]
MSIVYTTFLTGPFHFVTTNVSSPIRGLSLPGVAAAVEPPQEAALHSAVLPLTVVTAQATETPAPLPLLSPLPATPAEGMLAAAAAPAPVSPAPPPPVYIIYTVQEGDTVGGLAARYGISPTSIAWNNLDLENADMLVVGQYLRIPMSDGIIYEIRLGDTLSDIADRFGVDVPTIVNFAGNNLKNADGIAESQIVFIPNGTMPAPASTPAPAKEPSAPPSEEPRDTAPSAPAAPGPASSAGFIWPVHGPISSYFGPSHPLGIDIDQYNSPGGPIVAAASGVVTFAGGNSCCSYGLYVVINHNNGFETL